MQVVPLTLKKSNEFVKTYHTHNKQVAGCKFCIGVVLDNEIEAVAIVGRPVARKLDDGFTAEVLRLCTRQNKIKNLCSILYSRSWRIWKLMGGKRIITYTLEKENGASLKASGFKKVSETQAFKKGTGWTTRQGRVWQEIQLQKRIRWEYQI
tara:strand:- start:81 stop:536 length:456 start_codon:yes stop_codon:yes gene_type:complete